MNGKGSMEIFSNTLFFSLYCDRRDDDLCISYLCGCHFLILFIRTKKLTLPYNHCSLMICAPSLFQSLISRIFMPFLLHFLDAFMSFLLYFLDASMPIVLHCFDEYMSFLLHFLANRAPFLLHILTGRTPFLLLFLTAPTPFCLHFLTDPMPFLLHFLS